MKILKKIALLTPAVAICCLVFVQFVLSNDLASVGEKINTINQRIEEVQDENEFLKQQVAVAESLGVIEKKASELGFVKPTQFVILPPEQPVALR